MKFSQILFGTLFFAAADAANIRSRSLVDSKRLVVNNRKTFVITDDGWNPDPDPAPPSSGCSAGEAAMNFRIDRDSYPTNKKIFFLVTNQTQQPFVGDGIVGGYPSFNGFKTLIMESAYCIPNTGTYVISFWDDMPNDAGKGRVRLYIDGVEIDSKQNWGSRYGVKFELDNGKVTIHKPDLAKALSCAEGEYQVKVSIETDMFASRIGWALTEQNQNGGTELLSQNVGEYDDNLFATHTYSVCSKGPWLFHSHNSKANLGCCDGLPSTSTGSYKIRVDGVVVASGDITEPIEMIQIRTDDTSEDDDDDPTASPTAATTGDPADDGGPVDPDDDDDDTDEKDLGVRLGLSIASAVSALLITSAFY